MKYFVRAALVAALIVAGATSHVQAQALQSAAFDNEITAADVTCYTFNSNLTIGSQGGDVMALQIYLAQKGFLTLPAGQTPNINSYFGRLTKAAVAKYQSTVGISPSGFVGPLTRGRINTEFACSEGSTSSNDSSSNNGSQTSEEVQVVGYTNGRERSAAMVVGKPAITLERGINNEETNLVARFEILVASSKNSPVTFIGDSNIINFETKAGDGGQVRSLKTQFYSAKNVTATKNDYGYPLYVVAPNTVGRITLVARVNAKELFAGQYRARIASIIYTQSNGEQMDELPVVNAGNKYTEQVRIIGEVSPYISSVSTVSKPGYVTVNGVRFSADSSNKVTIYTNGAATKTFVLKTESTSALSFPVSYLPTYNQGGYYSITVTNSSLGDAAGLSNLVGFNYQGTVSGTGGNTNVYSDYVARIDSISPSPAPLGSKIKIKGANFGGFEADYIATLKRVSDGTSYSIRDDARSNEGRTDNGEMIITLKEPCKYGQKTYADYSGIEYICKLPPMTPGEYIVTVQTYGDQTRSNEYKLVVTNPTGAAAVAPSNITAEARIVDVGSNYVGYWGVWQPGTGNANKTADDWHWAARITSPKAAVVKSVTITNGYGEGWSTSDTAKVNGVLTYPLKFKTATQENSGPNKTLTLNEGSTIVNFWGQVESRQYSGGTITLTLDDGSTVTAPVPASSVVQGSTSSTQPAVEPATTQTQVNAQQSPSSIAPQMAVAVQDSVEARVVDAGSDYVGIWGTWKPGRGNTNPTNKDWHWAARLTTGAAKTIQSVTVTNGGESWSTADIQVGGTPSYPLKYMSAFKTNSAVNDRFDVQAGSTIFNLWGQIETGVYNGGTIRVVFTDGSSVAAQIAASPIKPAVEAVPSATVTNSTITEGIVNSSATSGLPGSSITLKLAGVKTPVTANDINIGPYAAQNLSFNATTNEATFALPWDIAPGTYDLVWFGPTSSYVIKFTVLSKTTFNFDASDLVGSVIGVLKTLF